MRKPMATLRHPADEYETKLTVWRVLGIWFGGFFSGYLLSHVATVLRTID